MEDKDVALLRAEDLITRILHETEATEYTVYLGGVGNFRYAIYPEYKGNRKDVHKPTWLEDCREHLVLMHNAKIINDIESDDAMGIDQCSSENTIIVSNDKDMLMIPGRHFNPITGVERNTSPLDGLKHFYQQLIQGDQADNIPGYDGKMRPKIPKFLQPRIDELWGLKSEKEMYELVLNMYDLDEDRLLRNARLLWIQRKEGDEWQPPKDRQDDLNS